MFGNVKGGFKSKWNRATKLGYRFNELDQKFRQIIMRGYRDTEHKRCALALLLMMHTGVRVGNDSSAAGYWTKVGKFSKKPSVFVHTYGLTTLTSEHLWFTGNKAHLQFEGKKQVVNKFVITDAEIVKGLKNLVKNYSGETLFGLTDYTLNRFIKTYVGSQFTAKDFRCMKANLYAWEIAEQLSWTGIKKGILKKQIREIFVYVSERLNNTPGVCKKSYVHDALPMYFTELGQLN